MCYQGLSFGAQDAKDRYYIVQEASPRQKEGAPQHSYGARPGVELDTPAASLAVHLSSASEVPPSRSGASQTLDAPLPESGLGLAAAPQRGDQSALQQSGRAGAPPAAPKQQPAVVDQHSSASSPEKGQEGASQASAQPVSTLQVGIETYQCSAVHLVTLCG